MALDKSLDDVCIPSSAPTVSDLFWQIISEKKTTRRPRRTAAAAKAAITGQTAVQAATRRAATAPTAARPVPGNVVAEKIIVSNLPTDVNEAQVKVCNFLQFYTLGADSHVAPFQELFQTTVGPTNQCQLQYSQEGRSLGIATVKFSRRGDANKAFQQYNNRLIDGS